MRIFIKLGAFILLLPFFMGSSCKKLEDSENCHRKYIFINNSDRTIRLTESVSYPDSTILDGIGVTSYILAPGESRDVKNRNTCYETTFQSGLMNKHNTLMVFLFDEEVFKKYTFDEIREKRMWLKKYDIRLEDFQRMDCFAYSKLLNQLLFQEFPLFLF